MKALTVFLILLKQFRQSTMLTGSTGEVLRGLKAGHESKHQVESRKRKK